MRKSVLAGNWKMNLTKAQAVELYSAVSDSMEASSNEIIVFPPAIYLDALNEMKRNVSLGVQNFYFEEKGAFTGEISVTQVKELGATHVLIGHSERRMYFGEDENLLKNKVDAALAHGLTPVFCCGEPLEIREAETQLDYVCKQLEASLFHLSADDFAKLILAYEPIWAIGTGKTASSDQAEEMHAGLRLFISGKYGTELADNVSILYGGSCNPSNANELFSKTNVDGGLIGGAALKPEDFLAIEQAF